MGDLEVDDALSFFTELTSSLVRSQSSFMLGGKGSNEWELDRSFLCLPTTCIGDQWDVSIATGRHLHSTGYVSHLIHIICDWVGGCGVYLIMWLSCDTDTEVMCNENKGHVSSFKSLLLACQVCILSFTKIDVEFFYWSCDRKCWVFLWWGSVWTWTLSNWFAWSPPRSTSTRNTSRQKLSYCKLSTPSSAYINAYTCDLLGYLN